MLNRNVGKLVALPCSGFAMESMDQLALFPSAVLEGYQFPWVFDASLSG